MNFVNFLINYLLRLEQLIRVNFKEKMRVFDINASMRNGID